MAGTYDSPVTDDTALVQELVQMRKRLRELEAPTGTQTSQLLSQMQALIDGILAQTEVNVTGNVTAGGTVTGGNVNSAGTGTFAAGVTSVGVFNLDVSTLPGTRRTNWVNANGQVGYAPSSITKKANVENYVGRAADFLACQPVVFEYMGQVAIRDNPENPYYDPTYAVPLEFGLIAEWLIEHNLSEFVFFDGDGITPAGINYAEFAAVGFLIVGRDHERRIAKLEGVKA